MLILIYNAINKWRGKLFLIRKPYKTNKNISRLFYILMMLYSLAVLLPSLSLMVRRLHDIGKSGTYILMGLIPVVGYIFILVYMLTGSAPDNQYGPKKV